MMSLVRSLLVVSPAVLIVFAAGLMQGLTLVSFPAASPVLKQDFGFSDAAYGAIFLPQVALAVAGAVAGGGLAHRVGLKALLVVALLANVLSQVLLASAGWASPGAAFALVMAGTAMLGLGFGLLGAPINSYPPMLFPRQPHASVVAAHTLLGLGLAIGPLIAGGLISAGMWVSFPVLLAALNAALFVGAMIVALPQDHARADHASEPSEPRPWTAAPFWMFVAITVLYAFAEGTFANWAVIYLSESKGLPDMTAGFALSAFWGALVFGRLAIAGLVTRVRPGLVWASLPVLMIAAFLALPYAHSAAAGIGLFALAGLACSGFLPLTITLLSHRFPHQVAWVSSMVIAALMVGVGLGSYAIGALREFLSLEELYRLSAAYPAAVLLLAVILLRSAPPSITPTPSHAPRPRKGARAFG